MQIQWVGRAFQNFVNDSLQLVENTDPPIYSPAREGATLNSSDGVQRGVVPDTLGVVYVYEYNQQLVLTYSMLYPNSYFYEVKFHSGPIYLSSFQHQILGYVDIASRSLAGVAPSTLGTRRPTPAVELITPSDSVVGLSVITSANQERVAIYQRIVCDAPLTASTTDQYLGQF